MKIALQKSIGFIETAAMFLGLMAAVVLLSLNSARSKSRDAKRISDIRQISSALELYQNDKQQFPENATGLLPVYIGTLPIAPEPPDGSCSPTDNRYSYSRPAKDSYQLTFCLGQATGGYGAGKHTLTPKGIE